MKVAVVIPTVRGREQYLERCLRGYRTRHATEHEILTIVVRDRWSGGMAWQEGAEIAAKQGADYLHLTNDDIVPGEDWLAPMITSVERGQTPVVLIVTATPEVLDENQMPLPGNPISAHSSHFEGVEKIQPPGVEARMDNASEYPSLPFCSMEQWQRIKPMIPSHYGTDKWFGYRAKQAGIPNVCVTSTFYHYAATIGRDNRIGWLGQDRLVFDQNVAYPMYVAGTLALDELHPEAKTDRGREMAREWYLQHVGGACPYWEG